MALTETVGTFLMPHRDACNAKTKHYIEVLQTMISGSTQGVYKIFKTQTADNAYLYNLNLFVSDVTTSAKIIVMYGTQTLGCLPTPGSTTPAAGPGVWNVCFAPFGLMGLVQGGGDLTSAVTLNISGATATVHVIGQLGVLQ